jgi:hypothetical protein
MSDDLIRDVSVRARAFIAEAHKILGVLEAAQQSRVAQLDQTYRRLSLLNLRQDDLMRQALRCAELGLFRAAHVMAWAAFMDYLEQKLASDGLVRLRTARPKWQGRTIEEMREYVPERQLVEVTQPLGLCTKNEMQALVSLLNRRNECAHPSDYYPELNETLGYISETLKRLERLATKVL